MLGSDLNQKLRIKFERAGVKTVMVRYANLELACLSLRRGWPPA